MKHIQKLEAAGYAQIMGDHHELASRVVRVGERVLSGLEVVGLRVLHEGNEHEVDAHLLAEAIDAPPPPPPPLTPESAARRDRALACVAEIRARASPPRNADSPLSDLSVTPTSQPDVDAYWRQLTFGESVRWKQDRRQWCYANLGHRRPDQCEESMPRHLRTFWDVAGHPHPPWCKCGFECPTNDCDDADFQPNRLYYPDETEYESAANRNPYPMEY